MPLKAILLDADGTLWRGREALPGAPEFIRNAQAAGLRCMLISNNAGPDREAYHDKCQRLGLNFAPEDIFSVNHLAGPFAARHHLKERVFVVGSEKLAASMAKHVDATSADAWLAERGIENRPAEPRDLQLTAEVDFDAVMIGIDVNVSYLKLALACVLVQRGAVLLGANPDYSFPFTGNVVLPGNGSIVSLVAGVTGVKPTYLGKPELHMLELIEEETGISRTEMIMVGDRLETDIAFANAAGIPGYLVLGGVCSREQAQTSGLPMDIMANLDALVLELGLPGG